MNVGAIRTRLAGGWERLSTGRSIRFQMARGSLWLGSGSAAENALRMARNMILARLLAPGAFGAMAIVLAVNGALEALTEVGIREAVIQNPRGARRAYLNGAWWLAVTRGLGLYAIAWLAAPWAADFYGKPWLTPVMRVAFLGTVFNGLISPRAYVALKRLRYRQWVIVQQGGAFIGITTAIVLGMMTHSLWALAIGFAMESAGRCLISYIVCPFRPGLHADRESWRALLRFAGGMAGVPMLTLLYAKSDVFVLGKMVSDEALGLYTLAAALAYIPDTLCSMAISPVLLPVLSKMQHEQRRMAHNLLRVVRALALIFIPPMALMACLGPWILRVIYGPPYAAAGPAFAVLCAGVAVRILGWAPVTAFFALGRPDLSRRASALRLIVLISMIVPLVHWGGPLGAALALLASGLAWAGFAAWQLRRLLNPQTARRGSPEIRKTGARPTRTCLLGASLDGGNLGVGALGVSSIGLIRQAWPEARIQLFYGEHRGGLRRVDTAGGPVTVRVLNFRLSPRAHLGEHLAVLVLGALAWRALPPLRRWITRHNARLRALTLAARVGSLHGGDGFSDIYGLRRFFIGIVPDAIAMILGRPVIFLPQTYGPFDTPAARFAARWLMRRAVRIYARDAQSLVLARRMLGREADRAEFCPDVAFSLAPSNGIELAIQPPLPPRGQAGPLVGLNISGLLAMGGYTRDNMFALACDYNDLADQLIEKLTEAGARVVIVPHVIDASPENDRDACERLWRAAALRHNGRVHLLRGNYTPGQVKQLIGRCDFFIGSRMHACIAALSQGVPAAGIAYSAKFQGVFEAAGAAGLAVDARNLDEETIAWQCLAAFENREDLAAGLRARAAWIHERLGEVFAREFAGRVWERPLAPARPVNENLEGFSHG